MRYHSLLTISGLAFAAVLLLGPGLAGAQRVDSQPTQPSGDLPTGQLPHELEEQRLLESRWEKGLDEEQALEIMQQQQAIEESMREYEESAQEQEAQIGYPQNTPQRGSKTASVSGPFPSRDLKEFEALVRRELVPILKATGASDADIEMMVRDITHVLAGVPPAGRPPGRN